MRKRLAVESQHHLAALTVRRVAIKAFALLAIEYMQGRQASQLLELLRVVIDGCGSHFSARDYSTCGRA